MSLFSKDELAGIKDGDRNTIEESKSQQLREKARREPLVKQLHAAAALLTKGMHEFKDLADVYGFTPKPITLEHTFWGWKTSEPVYRIHRAKSYDKEPPIVALKDGSLMYVRSTKKRNGASRSYLEPYDIESSIDRMASAFTFHEASERIIISGRIPGTSIDLPPHHWSYSNSLGASCIERRIPWIAFESVLEDDGSDWGIPARYVVRFHNEEEMLEETKKALVSLVQEAKSIFDASDADIYW